MKDNFRFGWRKEAKEAKEARRGQTGNSSSTGYIPVRHPKSSEGAEFERVCGKRIEIVHESARLMNAKMWVRKWENQAATIQVVEQQAQPVAHE